jgi:hypothetical protein
MVQGRPQAAVALGQIAQRDGQEIEVVPDLFGDLFTGQEPHPGGG